MYGKKWLKRKYQLIVIYNGRNEETSREGVITTVRSIRTLFQILFHMLSSYSQRGSLLLSDNHLLSSSSLRRSLLLSKQLELYFRNCPTCLVPTPRGGHYYCQINKNSILDHVPHAKFLLLEGVITTVRTIRTPFQKLSYMPSSYSQRRSLLLSDQ